MLSNDTIEKLNIARDNALGPREERTRNKASCTNGHYDGGIRFERSARAIPVKNTRCYSIGLTYQVQPNLVAPSAGGKVRGGGLDDELKERKFMVEVMMNFVLSIQSNHVISQASIEAACESQRHGVRETHDVLKEHAELINHPRIGSTNNFFYSSVQYNVAPAQPYNSNANLQDLGFFGSSHYDKNDAVSGYSAMIANSDLPDDYDKGSFFLVELGCRIYLESHVIAHFSGLRTHGGIAPTAPVGLDPVDWAYRWIVICYPSTSVHEARGLQALAALPDQTTFKIRPEMTELVYV